MAAIVLAAGRGARFSAIAGDRAIKLLAPLGGRPILQFVLDAVAAVGPALTVVVLGHQLESIERAMVWRSERRVQNPDPDRGLSSSVQVGLLALAADPAAPQLSGALILLGDQPHVHPDGIQALLRAADTAPQPFLVARYRESSSFNPVLVRRSAWALADQLRGDRGFGPLLTDRPDLAHEVTLAGTNPDVDKPADIARM